MMCKPQQTNSLKAGRSPGGRGWSAWGRRVDWPSDQPSPAAARRPLPVLGEV